MASILDKYGIKEVADVTFYEIGSDGKPSKPVLYLDTLKVSTIEQTAEEANATGGKGNAPLIVWDYGKEITVTLEDALFSAKSMAIMFGNGSVGALTTTAEATESKLIMRTEEFVVTSKQDGSPVGVGWTNQYIGPDGSAYTKLNPKFYTDAGIVLDASATFEKDQKYFCTYDLVVGNSSVIEISASTFPGTYYVTGDTYARSETTGKDEFFQFIIPKAKVQSENTITLEADGDPSVFNMNLRVLRPADGKMMQLIKYDLANGAPAAATTTTIPHNHTLTGTGFSL